MNFSFYDSLYGKLLFSLCNIFTSLETLSLIIKVKVEMWNRKYYTISEHALP
jgi:hypothetical protein